GRGEFVGKIYEVVDERYGNHVGVLLERRFKDLSGQEQTKSIPIDMDQIEDLERQGEQLKHGDFPRQPNIETPDRAIRFGRHTLKEEHSQQRLANLHRWEDSRGPRSILVKLERAVKTRDGVETQDLWYTLDKLKEVAEAGRKFEKDRERQREREREP